MKFRLPVFKNMSLVVFCLFLAGCGYTTRSQVMEKYQTIYVRQFLNSIDITSESSAARRLRTNYPAIETTLTKAVIDRFVWDGDIRPSREEEADLILKGEVKEFRRNALKYISDTEDVEEYRITLVISASLTDRNENKILWKDNSLAGDTTYYTMGPYAMTEEAAVKDAVEDVARRVVERVVENW